MRRNRWKRWAPVSVAALSSAMLAGRVQRNPSGGMALAAGPAVRNLGSGLVAIATGANDAHGNRLVLVDTGPKRQIMVDYDQMLLYTKPEVSLTHEEVVGLVREAERRAAVDPAGATR